MQTNPQSIPPQELHQRPAPTPTSPTPGLTPSLGPAQPAFTPTPRPALLPSSTPTLGPEPSLSPEVHTHRPEIPRPIELPPKPKPGRKAATDVPEDKRKASNRDAQRRFREKRRKKIQELQEQVEAERQARMRDQATSYQQLHEYEETKRQLHVLQHEQQQPQSLLALDHQHPTPRPFKAPPQASGKFPVRTAPDWSPEARKEIKSTLSKYQMPLVPPIITTSHSSRASRGSQASSSATITTPSSATTLSGISPGTVPDFTQRKLPSVPEVDPSSSRGAKRESSDNDHGARDAPQLAPLKKVSEVQDELEMDFTNMGRSVPPGYESGRDCGFCYGSPVYCLCVDMNSDNMPTPPPESPFSGRYGLMEPPVVARGAPGECDSCQKDPEQRRICMDMARNTFSGSNTRSSSVQASTLGECSPPASAGLQSFRAPSAQFMPCSSAISWVRREAPHITRQPWYRDVIQNVRVTGPHAEGECLSPAAKDSTDEEHHSHAQDVEVASILTLLGNAKNGGGGAHNDSGYGAHYPDADDGCKESLSNDLQHSPG